MGFFRRKDDEPDQRAGHRPPGVPEPAAGRDNLQRLVDYLDAHEWHHTVSDEHPLIRMGYTGDHGEWMVYLGAEDDGVVRVHSVLSQRIPEERRFEMSHLLTLANYKFRIGAFQFDFSDGELRFHTSVDMEGGVLTDTMIENLLWFNLSTVDRYYRAIMAVSYGNVAALTAYENLENELPS